MPTAPAWDERTRHLVRATIGKGQSEANLALLEHLAVSKGLDPLAGELLLFNGRTPIISINGATKLCAQLLDGIDTEFFDSEGNTTPVWLSDQPPAACAVSVWRKGCTRAFTASCRFKDYKGPGKPWQQMPSTMIRKCALAAALRLGFADLLAGLYAREEMEQAGMAGEDDGPMMALPAAAPQAESRKAPIKKRSRIEDLPASPEAIEDLADSYEAVENEDDPTEEEPPAMPHRAFDQVSVQKLFDHCSSLGMTAQGWLTLERQLGGSIDPKVAQQIHPKMTAEKVALLNRGLPTTTAAAGVR